MAPPSLGAFCRTIAIANIDEVTYVSDLPYDKVRDILRQVRSGSHLKLIEDASPQIKKHDAELWESLTRKEFPLQLKRMKKLNNDEDLVVDCWRTLNLKLRKEDGKFSCWFLPCLQNMRMLTWTLQMSAKLRPWFTSRRP